jgi:O-antigen ligase
VTPAPHLLDGHGVRIARFARTRDRAEKAFVVLAFCLFFGAATSLVVGEEQLTADGREILRLLFLPIYAVTVLLLLPRARSVIEAVSENWPLALPCLAAGASILWSIAPDITARRCIGLLFTSLFGVYLYERYSLSTILRLLAAACGAITLLSYTTVMLFPATGITPMDGTWRGIFPQKNALGQCVFLGILSLTLISFDTAKQQAVRYAGLILSAVMLWYSGSRTPLIALVGTVPILLSVRSFRLGATTGAAFSLFILTAAYFGGALALLNAENVLDLLGKDASLTGRIELWAMAEAAIAERPWLGYGYGAFWETPDGPSRAIWEIIGWDAPNAHNGYMDLILNIGVLGPALLLVVVGTSIGNCVSALRQGRTLAAECCLAVIFATILIAMDESSLFFEQNSVFPIVFVAASMHARRASRTLRGGACRSIAGGRQRPDIPPAFRPSGRHGLEPLNGQG